MPFPYLAPIKKWMKDVLEEREKNPNDTNMKMPWIVLTSGAKVIKGDGGGKDATERVETLKKLIANNEGPEVYCGCIIKNNIEVPLNYQTGETVVGIDFFGKQIKVKGESNRRISTPIIESVEIDTDGANNTLKTARVTVRCFSLKQFEMFELFFCKPGMNVLLEYGDNTLDRKTYQKVSVDGKPSFSKSSEALIEKNDYNKFINEFADYYRVNTESLKNYLLKIERAKGTYDLVAGKVTDYNFSIDADGTYSVSLEISQGNQMTLAIPINISNTKSTIKSPPKNANTFEQWISQLSSDLNLNKTQLSLSKADWEKEFFNWGKLNTTKKDETASSVSYLSLRFILKVLMNYSLVDGNIDENTWKLNVPTYNVGGSQKEIIPIQIHKNLISSSEDILFPNKTLPKFIAKLKPEAASDNTPQDKIELSIKSTEDGTINGYTIEEPADVKILLENDTEVLVNEKSGDLTCGNALNIFINYKTVVQIWRASYTRADFLKGILSTINANSYGLFRLIYAPKVEGEGATIIDFKSQHKEKITPEKLYKFKPTTINSIVRDFSFNFEMSNLVAGRTVFNAQRFLSDYSKNKQEQEKGKEIQLPPDVYKSVDYSMFSNADGYYSINTIDLKAIQKTIQDAVSTGKIQADNEKKEEENEEPDLTEVIEQKSIKFILPNGIKTLIFTDRELLVGALKVTEENKKSTLTPIDVTITIDGISGFSCGEYFNIDGVPEVYNQIGVFQITNTKHNLTREGWTTTLEAEFRINKKE